MRRQHSDAKVTKKRIKAYKTEPKDVLSDDDDLPLLHTMRNNVDKNPISNLDRQESTVNTVQNSNPLDLCCCCLELFCTKNVWLEYTWMGQGEVYGDMLKECFDIKFPSEWGCREKICEVCITRLRNSYRFKRQVVLCQAKLSEKLAAIVKSNVVNAETMVKIERLESERNLDRKDVKAPSNIRITETSNNGTNFINADPGLQSKMGQRYDEEEDIHIDVKLVDEKSNLTQENENQLECDASLHENDGDYYDDDPIKYLNTEKEQKEKSKVQMKKGFKLKRISLKNVDRRTLSTHRSDYTRPRQNIGLLLEHSTIIPFKSNKGYFNCLYCNKQYIVFEQLRVHVLDIHKDITFHAILKCILRPNDRIKADVSDMTCRRCSERLETIERLVEHLEGHNIKFSYDDKLLKPTDCVLPYNLSNGKFKCCVCEKDFPFFKTLTKHMNDHSTNFVCDVCGKCFLLPERLRAHVSTHVNTSTVNCEHCGKICASNAHLRSHKRHHHKKRSHVCCICNKSFATFKERMQHLQDVHNRSPPDLDCKICLKRFKTTSHLGCHVRTEHFNIPYVRKRKNKRDECQRSVY